MEKAAKQNTQEDNVIPTGWRNSTQLHPGTFNYLNPTDKQVDAMRAVRNAYTDFAAMVGHWLPDGPDKTYVLRKLRECAMWSNIALTRLADGSPRE